MYSVLQLSVVKYNDHKYFFNFLINDSGVISFIFIGWQMFAKIWICCFYTFSLISVLLTLRYIVKYIVLLIIQYDLPPFLNFKLLVRSTWMRTLSYYFQMKWTLNKLVFIYLWIRMRNQIMCKHLYQWKVCLTLNFTSLKQMDYQGSDNKI